MGLQLDNPEFSFARAGVWTARHELARQLCENDASANSRTETPESEISKWNFALMTLLGALLLVRPTYLA